MCSWKSINSFTFWVLQYKLAFGLDHLTIRGHAKHKKFKAWCQAIINKRNTILKTSTYFSDRDIIKLPLIYCSPKPSLNLPLVQMNHAYLISFVCFHEWLVWWGKFVCNCSIIFTPTKHMGYVVGRTLLVCVPCWLHSHL